MSFSEARSEGSGSKQPEGRARKEEDRRMSGKPPRRYKVEVRDPSGQTRAKKFRDRDMAMNFMADQCAAGCHAQFTDLHSVPRNPRREETPRRPRGEKYRNDRAARSSYPPPVV